MKYIIMAGGNYHTDIPKHLLTVKGEPIIARTIRLLRENGITDIAISATDDRFEQFSVPVLRHDNRFGDGGMWLDAFYPTTDPACYVFGDVVFSPEAIKTIVEYQTDSIMFFGSTEPVQSDYPKLWAEPFAYKVIDQELFRSAIRIAKHYGILGKFHREPVSWELWQVIKGTPLDVIDFTNYCAINDYTCDVDFLEDLKKIERLIP